jgi:hypothetical protein
MKHVQILKKIIYVSKWTLQNMDILWSLNGVMKRQKNFLSMYLIFNAVGI